MTMTGMRIAVETAIQSIAKRAYAIWESEGRPSGRDFEHWLRAEAEITAPASAPPRKRRSTTRSRAATPKT